MSQAAPIHRPLLLAAFAVLLAAVLRGQQPPLPPAPAPQQVSPPAAPETVPQSQVPWLVMDQETWIDQGHPAFNSPYEGPNSLDGASQAERTFSLSLFLGYRILADTEVYFDPEVFQGHGLSNTLGMAGFPNGEAVKAAFPNLHYNTSRLFLRHTFGLGGEKETIEDDPNKIAGSVDVDRITLTVGKLAASDCFDDNAYS